eukprot:TRINITY_DN775_c0_g1_i1.p1 TRINITY_DN775_c0_g1~~TRINITY_DN775_c0_g1_i1.p1  ORF type:complete len:144 (-),score=32.23 TRINITY_DN775_c0_g1_i1:193-624(-)
MCIRDSINAEYGVPKLLNDEQVMADKGYQDPHRRFMAPIQLRNHRRATAGLPVEECEEYNRLHKQVMGRHEKVNGLFKEFGALAVRKFRHSPDKHRACFHAVAQITQVRLFLNPRLLDTPAYIPVIVDGQVLYHTSTRVPDDD